MKKYILMSVIIAISIVAVPLLTLSAGSADSTEKSAENEIKKPLTDTIAVYFSGEEKTEELSFREYIIGVVAAEMPVEFHSEALSALTCAAATLARKNQEKGRDESLGGAVISTDSAKHQAYMTKEEMREKWGEGFDEYYEKLTTAVDKAIDYSLTYDGELIVAAYHSMSAGKTEDSGNVWGKGLPYLTSVESTGDMINPKFFSEITVGFNEFRKTMESEGAEFPEDKALWIGSGTYTEAGTLKAVSVGSKEFSGEELREIFSLRSAAVKLGINREGVVFSVRGYGHGVGLSQYGANYLAKLGYSWEEILKHYYTGVEISVYNS